MNILTNDPSFTAWGYAVITSSGEIINTGCIKTAPEHKKMRIRKGDDRIRRISEINTCLINIIKKYDIGFILSELPHGSQNAQAAVMIGVVIGIVQTLSDLLNIPVEYYSEQDAKKSVLNKKSATKEEMITAIGNIYPVKWSNIGYKDEAVADAMAIYHVAKMQSNILKMINK